MAKLNDAKIWLENVLSDAQRANSLISRARDQSLFTKGRRGGIAPDLILDDYAKLCLCALYSGLPSQVREQIDLLGGLKISGIEVDLNDRVGWRGPFSTDDLHEDIHETLEPYGLEMRSMSRPQESSVYWAIIMLFMHFTPKNDFHAFDRIELIEQGRFKQVSVTLHEADYGVGLDGYYSEGAGHRAVRLTFQTDDKIEQTRLQSTRTLFAPALNDLAAMTKWMGEAG